uniref:Uncharacterized protein n=1 Tax=Hyaloperonospora arabidopsidis (strain Emoy2) TaxID=559515 RepID=M4B222_HYAAE
MACQHWPLVPMRLQLSLHLVTEGSEFGNCVGRLLLVAVSQLSSNSHIGRGCYIRKCDEATPKKYRVRKSRAEYVRSRQTSFVK